MSDLERRVREVERGRENDRNRLRNVENAIVRLGELPDKIDRLGERLETVIRLEERVNRLESDVSNLSETVDENAGIKNKIIGGIAIFSLVLGLVGPDKAKEMIIGSDQQPKITQQPKQEK